MFKLEFGTDNAAFDDDKAGEINHILREAGRKINAGSTGELIRDVNGNIIGRYELTQPEGEE